jgi:dihydroxyacetone kinase-like protein
VQEAGGYQLIACKLDDELKELWDAPCNTPYFRVR